MATVLWQEQIQLLALFKHYLGSEIKRKAQGRMLHLSSTRASLEYNWIGGYTPQNVNRPIVKMKTEGFIRAMHKLEEVFVSHTPHTSCCRRQRPEITTDLSSCASSLTLKCSKTTWANRFMDARESRQATEGTSCNYAEYLTACLWKLKCTGGHKWPTWNLKEVFCSKIQNSHWGGKNGALLPAGAFRSCWS